MAALGSEMPLTLLVSDAVSYINGEVLSIDSGK
jgi:hypothetical protein